MKKSKLKKGQDTANLSSQENTDEDIQEARKTLEIGKWLGFMQKWRIKLLRT